MKKFISLILSVVLVLTMCVPAFAELDSTNDYPVVLVPGFSSSSMQLDNGDGTFTKVWGLDFDNVLQRVEDNIAKLALGVGLMTAKDYEYLAEVVGKEFLDICGVIACNPDGTSKYNVSQVIPNTADACRWSTLDDTEKSERDVMKYVQKYVSDDDIYNFTCDFRMSVVENAEKLDTLIRDIIDTTGCEKVNILCISHGGQVTGTYLSLHGTEGLVNNCVMCMPAMGGAALAYDAMSGIVALDEDTLMSFIEYGQELETDYHLIFKMAQLGFLDDFIQAILPYVYQIIRYWTSLWDFIPLEYFDSMVATLDPAESQPLIDTTTWFHENILPNYAENLQAAEAAGVNISILTGSGIAAVTGLQENSDAIIRTTDTTGAKCAPFSKRFSDGYVCEGTSCSDSTHNHLSPSMEIDASCCWLPESTWFVDGLYHGMELFDDYTMDLVVTQLMSKTPMDVHSNPDFPQFTAASAHSNTVHAAFDVSGEGYLSSEDKNIVVTNTTKDSLVSIFAVTSSGIKLDFDDDLAVSLKPGQSAKISFEGEIPAESLTRMSVTITYIARGSYTPVGSRTLDFTIMNGAAVPYDSSNPYSDADFEVKAVNVPDGAVKDFINNSNLTDLYNAFTRIISKFMVYILRLVEILRSM